MLQMSKLDQVGRTRPKFCRSLPEIDRFRTKFGELRANSGQHGPKFDSGQNRPKHDAGQIWQVLVEFGPTLAKLGSNSLDAGQSWKTLSEVSLNLVEFGRNLAKISSNLAGPGCTCPMLVEVEVWTRVWPKSARTSPNAIQFWSQSVGFS